MFVLPTPHASSADRHHACVNLPVALAKPLVAPSVARITSEHLDHGAVNLAGVVSRLLPPPSLARNAPAPGRPIPR